MQLSSKWHGLRIGIFACLTLLALPAQASEEELREAYAAYQEAAASGDVRGALPYAEAAYGAGREVYGSDSQNTGLLALNYGQLLFDLAMNAEAIDPLQNAVEILAEFSGTDAELARGYLLLSQALALDKQWSLARTTNARGRSRLSSRGMSISEEQLLLLLAAVSAGSWQHYHGGASNEHFSRSYHSGGPVARARWDRDRRRGHTHAHGQELTDLRRSQDLLEQAEQLINELPNISAEASGLYNLALGQVFMWERKYEEAIGPLDEAVRLLRSLDHVSDPLITAMSERIFANQNLHHTDGLEDMIVEAFELAHRRCDGGAVLLLQEMPPYGDGQFLMAPWGWVDYEFTIGPDGRALDSVITDRFISTPSLAEASLGRFVFAPAMSNCEPVALNDAVVEFHFEF